MPKGYLTTEQVAEIHKVTRGCVVQWIQSGYLEAEKVNQVWLIKEEHARNYQKRPITGRPVKTAKVPV